MLQRLWLIFAQAATVCVAALFVVATLKPEWLPERGGATKPAVPLAGQAVVPIAPEPLATSRTDSFHGAVLRSSPAVVNIFTSKEVRTPRNPLLNDPLFRRFFGEQFGDETQRATNLGSGVIVSSAGYILTNHHVVEAADEIEVALSDGKKLLAKVVGNDPETDLAVLRVNADKLPAITFGQVGAIARRRRGARDRQSLRLRADRHLRHRLGDRPQRPAHQHLRELHPDRRRHQSRQLGRRAGRRAAATSWASTPRSTRARAARWASASPFPCPRPAW